MVSCSSVFDLEPAARATASQVCLEQRLLLRARLAKRAVIYLEPGFEDCGRFRWLRRNR